MDESRYHYYYYDNPGSGLDRMKQNFPIYNTNNEVLFNRMTNVLGKNSGHNVDKYDRSPRLSMGSKELIDSVELTPRSNLHFNDEKAKRFFSSI
jgi:hypothetical protein